MFCLAWSRCSHNPSLASAPAQRPPAGERKQRGTKSPGGEAPSPIPPLFSPLSPHPLSPRPPRVAAHSKNRACPGQAAAISLAAASKKRPCTPMAALPEGLRLPLCLSLRAGGGSPRPAPWFRALTGPAASLPAMRAGRTAAGRPRDAAGVPVPLGGSRPGSRWGSGRHWGR